MYDLSFNSPNSPTLSAYLAVDSRSSRICVLTKVTLLVVLELGLELRCPCVQTHSCPHISTCLQQDWWVIHWSLQQRSNVSLEILLNALFSVKVQPVEMLELSSDLHSPWNTKINVGFYSFTKS